MNLVGFLGQILGLLIIAAVIYFVIKNKGDHPELFSLEDGEEIIKMAKGDYWEVEFYIQHRQYPGEFAFTNKKVMYRGNAFISFGKEIDIPYNQIASIEKSFVGLFFPVAFTIKTKDNKSYKFAIMKRQIYIDLINSLARQQETGEIAQNEEKAEVIVSN